MNNSMRNIVCYLTAVILLVTASGFDSYAVGQAPKVGFEVGNLAPEIQGEDLDGVKFKLSDYRGKVVVLDFWGDW
jgi:cytochrome oxidase Cu insertion factor (SCO1/SenC/PrrC family)